MGIDLGNGLFVEGDENAPVLVICEPPDPEAFDRGHCMTEQERKFFNYVAESYGFDPGHFAFLPCSFPMGDDVVGDRDQADHLAMDRDDFLSLLTQCNPEMIVVLGKHGLRQLSGRAMQIGKARGQVHRLPGIRQPVLPMFGVRQCLWYPDTINIFVSDFNMLAILDDHDYDPACLERATEDNTDYRYTLDLSEFFDNKPGYMAVDTETTGLKWTDPRVRVLTVQLTVREGHARVIPVDMRAARLIFPDMPERSLIRAVDRAKADVKRLLQDRTIRKIGHNIKFDHHQIRETLGYRVQNWFADTQQLAFVVDDNMIEKSLNEVTRRWVPEMAGYCLAPWTKVLTADMRHVRAEDVRVGDELATFDEHPVDGNRRRLREGRVTAVVHRQRPRFEVTTATGKVLTVSADHQFLARGKGGKWHWRKAQELTVGARLHPFPWAEQEQTYAAGYVAGILDGEGWIRKAGPGGAFRVGFAQKPGAVFDAVERTLHERGYAGWTRRLDDREGVLNVEMDGHQSLRALQQFQPARLVAKRKWAGACLHAGDGEAVTGIRYVGMGEVVSITTTERTLIAEGICQHNCDAFDATANKADMLGELRKDPARFLRYAGGDTDANFRAARTLVKMAQEDEANWRNYLYVQLPALQAFADKLEPTGLHVDLSRLAELEVMVERETEEVHTRVLSQIPAVIRRRHLRKGLRLSRAELKVDALFSEDGLGLTPIKFTKGTAHKGADDQVPSVSAKEHLVYFAHEPLVEGMMRWTKLDKMRGTYVGKEHDPEKGGPTGFWQHVVRKGDTTRIHPSFYLHRTRTGRSACVHGDTLVLTRRGEVPIRDICAGDEVWTHRGRWRKVLRGWIKPVEDMIALTLGNGEVLRCTQMHRVLTQEGTWRTIRHVCKQEARARQPHSGADFDRLQDYAGDGAGGGGQRGRVFADGELHLERQHTGTGILQAESDTLLTVKEGGQQPNDWKDPAQPARGLPGWGWLPDANGPWQTLLRAPGRVCGAGSWGAGGESARELGSAPHRQEPREQQPGQSCGDDARGTCGDTRSLPERYGVRAIAGAVYCGRHQVYDIEVEEDHSYLACGVFHHNSADPNAQNFPKRGDLAKAFRSIFVAPPGYKIIEADLSQAELRIAACQANEANMIRLYNEGIDIHANTGAMISGNDVNLFLANKKSDDLLLDRASEFRGSGAFLQKLQPGARRTATVADFIAQLRYQAKAVNFGFLYGMQHRKFRIYAKTDYGIDYTEQEAMDIREAFFEAYPGLIDWHFATEREVYEYGHVRALHGALRRLPAIYSTRRSIQSESVRQGINSPIQRFASDLGIMALWRLSRDCPDYVKPVAFIHDALVAYAREDVAEQVGSNIRWYMESAPLDDWFGLRLPLPIVADVSIGDRLSSMDEKKLPAIRPEWHNAAADSNPEYIMPF